MAVRGARRAPALALALVLAGCGAQQSQLRENRPAAERATRESPLAAYRGFGHDPEADENQHLIEESKRERLVAACMRRKGFQYTPAPSLVIEGEAPVRDEAYELGRDPDTKYLASLSPSERKAYSYALEGVPDLNAEGGPPPNGSGCRGEAAQAVPGVFAAYNALREPYELLEERVDEDPRVQEAIRRWAACMADEGYAYATPRALVAAPDTWSADEATDPKFAEHELAVSAGERCDVSAGLAEARGAARFDLETEFVEKYRNVLERFRP